MQELKILRDKTIWGSRIILIAIGSANTYKITDIIDPIKTERRTAILAIRLALPPCPLPVSVAISCETATEIPAADMVHAKM